MSEGTERRRSAAAQRRKADPGPLPELLGYNLRRAQVALFQDFAEAMQSFDITPGQFGVLVLIASNPGLNQSDLGHAMGVDRSTVVAVIDRLQGRGLVARHPAPRDRRSYALELTAQGQLLLSKLMPLVQAHEERFAKRLAEDERHLLITLLRRLAGEAPDTG